MGDTATVTINTLASEFEYEIAYSGDLNVVLQSIKQLQPEWTSAVIVVCSDRVPNSPQLQK